MRYLLFLLAACSSGWQQKPAAPEAAPDSRTEYTVEPPPPDEMAAMPAPRPCQWQQQAANVGLALSVSNATKANLDLCAWTDQAIGRLTNSSGLTSFSLDVALLSLKSNGKRIGCHVLVAVHSPTALIGVFEQTTNGSPSAADCIEANIDELVRQRAVPAIKRHALVSSPSPSP